MQPRRRGDARRAPANRLRKRQEQNRGEFIDLGGVRTYASAVKVKTSVALSRDVVTAIDRQTGGRGCRSAFIENAVRSYLTVLSASDRKDLVIINRRAKRLNEEAEDVLSYQVVP